MKAIIPAEIIEKKIRLIRGEKVMLSSDLGELYGVAPRTLIQAVKRNIERFPGDFMFQLSEQEFANLKSQTVASSWAELVARILVLLRNKGWPCFQAFFGAGRRCK